MRFRKGNTIGQATRWRKGKSGNPAGRPPGRMYGWHGWHPRNSGQFKKGVSVNPAGRPRGSGWRQIAEGLIKQVCPAGDETPEVVANAYLYAMIYANGPNPLTWRGRRPILAQDHRAASVAKKPPQEPTPPAPAALSPVVPMRHISSDEDEEEEQSRLRLKAWLTRQYPEYYGPGGQLEGSLGTRAGP